MSNEIQLLKTYTLVKKIGDVPISTEVILEALNELNEESDRHLGAFPQVKSYRAKNPNTVQHCHAYGENPALSIMKTGKLLKAFDFSDIAVRTMSEKFTHRVLQFTFGCMDL